MKNAVMIMLICLAFQSCSKVQKQFINPFPTKPNGYTHVVVARGAKTIYISGQVPVNEKGEIIGRGDFATQTRQVFEHIKTALAAANATFDDLVKITIYIKDYKPDQHLLVLRNIRNEYISKEIPPASTLVGVQSLFNSDVMIEIEAIAIIK